MCDCVCVCSTGPLVEKRHESPVQGGRDVPEFDHSTLRRGLRKRPVHKEPVDAPKQVAEVEVILQVTLFESIHFRSISPNSASIPFCSIRFRSVPFNSVQFHSISVRFYSVLFDSIQFHSIPSPFASIVFSPILSTFLELPFNLIQSQFNPIQSHLAQSHSITSNPILSH